MIVEEGIESVILVFRILPKESFVLLYCGGDIGNEKTFSGKSNIGQQIMLNRGLLSHPTDTFTEKMEDVDTDLQISSSQDSLMEAALAALGTGDMTPLVKEELKLTIQSRRLASGKGELRVNFEPPTQSELTEEERVKVDRRREQNRMAAQRFRQKQKTLGDRVQKQVRGLETDNTRLRAELRLLREERDDLRRRLTEHLKVCPGVSLYVVNT